MLSEKELEDNINELKNIINDQNNEIDDLKMKYSTLKFENKKYQNQLMVNSSNGGQTDDYTNKENTEVFINQLKDIQKTYKDRETKLINEKNEEIRKLKIKNKDLIRNTVADSSGIDVSKYVNEIRRLKNINTNLEEDLGTYKELNSKFVDSEKKSTKYETENLQLKNTLMEKNKEIQQLKKKERDLLEQNSTLEKQLVDSKGTLGEVLNSLAEAESKCCYLEEQQREYESKSRANNIKC